MKTTLIALFTLIFLVGAVRADSSLPSHLGLAVPNSPAQAAPLSTLSLAPDHSAAAPSFSLQSSSSDFAQLSTASARLPFSISPGLFTGFIAVIVLALRIFGLNRARALAEHERDSYHGKAKMFRSLQEESNR